jgi:hypothetical protein
VPALDIEGRSCVEGDCVSGYVCHPETLLCVLPVEVFCPPSLTACPPQGQYCPRCLQTGDSCPSVGSFLNCDPATADCSRGCRTCREDLTWSPCSDSPCREGAPEVCNNADDDCDDIRDEGIFACACSDGPPGSEQCNGVDDDCNDGIDDGWPCALGDLRSCAVGPAAQPGTELCSTTCAWSGDCQPNDLSPPPAVGDLAAVPGHRSARLSWTYPNPLPTNDLYVCEIRRGINTPPASVSEGLLAFRQVSPVANTFVQQTVEGLDNRTLYCFTIFCQDTSGNWNVGAALDDNATCTTPTAGPAQNPRNFDAVDGLDERVTIVFLMPEDPVTTCRVMRGPDGGSWPQAHDEPDCGGCVPIATVSSPGQTVTVYDDTVVNGTTYYYAAFCTNNENWNDTVDEQDPDRNADTGTPSDPVPQNPIDLDATDTADSLSVITFTMPPPPVTRCELRRQLGSYPASETAGDAVETFTGPAQAKRVVDVGIANGQTHYYAVFCLNGLVWNREVSTTPGSKNADTAVPTNLPLTFRESQWVGASATGTQVFVPTIAAGAHRLYVLTVAMQPATSVQSVSGGAPLSWQRKDAICGGPSETAAEVWWAFGTPASAFQTTVTLDTPVPGLAAVLVSYDGANPVAPLADVTHYGTGACTSDFPSTTWSLAPSRDASSLVLGVVSFVETNPDTHAPAEFNQEIEERHARSGANAIGIAVVETDDDAAPVGGTIPDLDSAAIAVEIQD